MRETGLTLAQIAAETVVTPQAVWIMLARMKTEPLPAGPAADKPKGRGNT